MVSVLAAQAKSYGITVLNKKANIMNNIGVFLKTVTAEELSERSNLVRARLSLPASE